MDVLRQARDLAFGEAGIWSAQFRYRCAVGRCAAMPTKLATAPALAAANKRAVSACGSKALSATRTDHLTTAHGRQESDFVAVA